MDRLYWVDSLLAQIGSISIVGIGRETFTKIGQITQPYSLTVYSGNILNIKFHYGIDAIEVPNLTFIYTTVRLNTRFRLVAWVWV